MLAQQIGDSKEAVLLNTIAEKIPTEAVIFDVSTDRGIRTGNQSITEIMYRLFLKQLGYAEDLDLAERWGEADLDGAVAKLEPMVQSARIGESKLIELVVGRAKDDIEFWNLHPSRNAHVERTIGNVSRRFQISVATRSGFGRGR